jgi:hypothetical protein
MHPTHIHRRGRRLAAMLAVGGLLAASLALAAPANAQPQPACTIRGERRVRHLLLGS